MKASPMGAEYGIRRIFRIRLGIVADGFYHFLGIVAGLIPFQRIKQLSRTFCIGCHLSRIAAHTGRRHSACEHPGISPGLRRLKASAHFLDIGHRPSDHLSGHFQTKGVHRLQQDALRLSQSLAHRPVSGLSKITALGMLLMRFSRCQSDLDIRDRRTGQHAQMFLFFQMRQDQPLPVSIQHIFTAGSRDLYPAARRSRFQDQVHFRIMAQRLKMSHAFYSIGNGFFIHNAAGAKFHFYAKPVKDQPL